MNDLDILNKINIDDVTKIAKMAGKAILEVYQQDFDVAYKDDQSPLTEADQKAHYVISASLKQLNQQLGQDIPILSEEGESIPYDERKQWTLFWLVDPLDGTKEFVKKNDEFTVNIALVLNGLPVLGVVYAPVLETCYWARQGAGAFKDGSKLPLKQNRSNNVVNIVASRSHMSKETQVFIEQIETDKEKKIVSIGSSLKMCLVAEGKADIYPRLGPTMEWDTAAAHAICNEAGASFLGCDTAANRFEFKYNKQNLLNSYFIVSL